MSNYKELRAKLKSGEYSGSDIMKAWIALGEMSALREESERARQANLDVMMHFEDMKAAKEKAEARGAELESSLAVWEGRRLVYGVGVCDADYQIAKEVKDESGKKKTELCPFYRTWRNMIARCYRKREHEHRPGYEGCTVCDEWKRFSSFKSWMETQDWTGNHLDKDILIPGNKVYSPETCAFISQSLNSFVLDRAACRGDLPLGVTFYRPTDRYKAQCKNPFTKKTESIGIFDSPELAHEAWRQRKHELACMYAETVDDPRVADALRARYAQRLRQQADEAEKAGGGR